MKHKMFISGIEKYYTDKGCSFGNCNKVYKTPELTHNQDNELKRFGMYDITEYKFIEWNVKDIPEIVDGYVIHRDCTLVYIGLEP